MFPQPWAIQADLQKSIVFKHGSKTPKIRILCPKVSQMDSKKGSKNMFKIIQFTKKLKKVKTCENIIIYYIFSTSNHQFSMIFPNKNVLKSNLKTDAGIYIPQISEKWANCSKTYPKEDPQIHQKSMKIQPWILMYPLCWPWGPLDRKMMTWGPQNESPGWKINPKTSTKNTFLT